MRKSRFLLFLTLSAVLTAALVILDGCSSAGGKKKEANLPAALSVIDEAYGLIQENAVYPVNGAVLVEGALRGMADTIGDPYSTYLTEEEAEAHRDSLAGEKVGIGAEITRSGSKYIVVAPVKGSPAEKAGLQPYDEIVRIDGEGLGSMSLQEVVKKIRGKAGTTLKMTIYRPDLNKHMELNIVREVISVKTVKSELKEERGRKFGYIALTMFGDETAEEWKKATDQLISEGAEALIIDVRGNPGGYLRAVAEITGSLLETDAVYVHMLDAQGTVTPLLVENSEKLSFDKELKKMPVALLQDKGSASASEVLSGALKDLKRGKIIGGTSFGKGTVQDTIELSNGGEMKLSTHKWLTPKQQWIHGKGVEADIQAEQDALFAETVRYSAEVYSAGDYEEDIAYAQRLLVGLGYTAGRQDGFFDDSTALAVHTFRKDQGIAEDSIMDGKFFAALRKEVEAYQADAANDKQLRVAAGYIYHVLTE